MSIRSAGSILASSKSVKRRQSSVNYSPDQKNPPEDDENISWQKIFTNLMVISFQTALGYVCLDIMFAISLHYVAEQGGDINSSGVGLAFAIIAICILPMGFGLNQSLNVHVAQAVGAEQIPLSKKFLPITILLHITYFIPFCLLVYFLRVPFSYSIPSENREQVIEAAWEYLPLLMVSSFLAVQLECFKAYMLAYEITTPFIFIHIGTTLLHIFWCKLFIIQLDMGIQGAGIAIIFTEFLNVFLLAIYICVNERSKEIFSAIRLKSPIKDKRFIVSYFKSSLSIVSHVYADFFVFFLLTFIGMQLETDQFNAQVAFSNTSNFYFRIPISLSLGLLTFVGGEMGKKNINNAKRYTIAGGALFFAVAIILILLLWFMREVWAKFYAPTNDNVKQNLVDTLPYFILGCLIIDGFQGSISGALKGIDKKNVVTYTTLVIYYLIGIPLVLVFTFDWGIGLHLTGIWLAFGITNAFLAIIFVQQLLVVNWQVQVEIIESRMEKQQQLSTSLLKSSQVDVDEFIQ